MSQDLIRIAIFVTDLADGGVMIPLCLAVAATLLLFGSTRIALAWTVAIGAVWGTMLVLKLAGYTLGDLVPSSPLAELGLITPSGHVASSAAIYGGMVGLLWYGPQPAIRRACLAAIGTALLIGVTRVQLGEHTIGEVLVGAVVGIAGAVTVVTLVALSRASIRGPTRAAVLGVAAAVVIFFHGSHLSWERTIRSASAQAVSDWSILLTPGR